MRVLVVSALYPPFAFGGYEVECSSVVDHMRSGHDVLVLTGEGPPGGSRTGGRDPAGSGAALGADDGVRRELPMLTDDARGALRAPRASVRAVAAARRALAWRPELIYVWNGSSIPQATLRVLADSGLPLAFRVCEHWFGEMFVSDQFMRELLPARRGPARAVWARACRGVNRMPALRLVPAAPMRAAISWNSEALRRLVDVPPFVEPVLERVGHSVPRFGDLYADVQRAPAEAPEIVFVGRVTPYKGLNVAIEALALLRTEHGIPARLVVIGPEDRDHAVELRRLAERLGLGSAVLWRGQQVPEQNAAALSRAHALIVPSTWEEPFPLVTIEAALARVPVVASDVGGIGEGMHHEEHALLFARGDAAAAAAALARTLQDTDETAARVARARDRAQAFRLTGYLAEQERFVVDARAAFDAAPPQPVASGAGPKEAAPQSR